MNPLLTICIPTYQRLETLKLSINAILCQLKDDNIEILVSDNCSKDGTVDYLKSVNDKRFRWISNKTNIGFVRNFAELIKHSRGMYLFFLSDEDSVFISNILDSINAGKSFMPGVILGGIVDINDEIIINFKDEVREAGTSTLLDLSYKTTYISGFFVKRDKIDYNFLFENLKLDGFGYLGIYPHSQLLKKTILESKTLTTSMVFVKIGVPITSSMEKIANDFYFTPLNRLNSFLNEHEMILTYKFDNLNSLKSFFFLQLKILIKRLIEYKGIIEVKSERDRFIGSERLKYSFCKDYFDPIKVAVKSSLKLQKEFGIKGNKLTTITLVLLYSFIKFLQYYYYLNNFHKLPTHNLFKNVLNSCFSRIIKF